MLPKQMDWKSPREKEDPENPKPMKMGNNLPLRMKVLSKNPRGRDLPKRTRTLQQRRNTSLRMIRSQSRKLNRSPSKMATKKQTRPNTERRVKSLRLLNLRRLLLVKISQVRRKRRDHKPLRSLKSSTAKRVQLLRKKRMVNKSQPILKIQRRILRRKKRRKRPQRTLFTRIQWNLLKRKSSNPSGRSTDMVTGERALARLLLLLRLKFQSNQRNFSSLQKRKHSIPSSKKLRPKSKNSMETLMKRRLNLKRFWVKSKLK